MAFSVLGVASLEHSSLPAKKTVVRALTGSLMPVLLEGAGVDTPVRAQVVERLYAGHYRYLRVRTEDGSTWLTTPKALDPETDWVRFSSLRTVDAFHSSRLNRRFVRLHFAMVTALPPPNVQSPTQ